MKNEIRLCCVAKPRHACKVTGNQFSLLTLQNIQLCQYSLFTCLHGKNIENMCMRRNVIYTKFDTLLDNHKIKQEYYLSLDACSIPKAEKLFRLCDTTI